MPVTDCMEYEVYASRDDVRCPLGFGFVCIVRPAHGKAEYLVKTNSAAHYASDVPRASRLEPPN